MTQNGSKCRKLTKKMHKKPMTQDDSKRLKLTEDD